ncbi:MAG TPA: hypothetical protein VGE40_00370 [Bacilli bacterium]
MQPLIISEKVTSLLEVCSHLNDDASKQLSLASIRRPEDETVLIQIK